MIRKEIDLFAFACLLFTLHYIRRYGHEKNDDILQTHIIYHKLYISKQLLIKGALIKKISEATRNHYVKLINSNFKYFKDIS